MTLCNLCPRNCNVERPEKADAPGKYGVCHSGWLPKIARAGLHYWEEPCISGSKGSGTVFFTGCNLHCVFCQNYDISFKEQGKEVSVEHLREIYHDLIVQGAHNINLVTAAHYVEAITESLQEPLPVPVVYNSSGFEKVETLKKLAGCKRDWRDCGKW